MVNGLGIIYRTQETAKNVAGRCFLPNTCIGKLAHLELTELVGSYQCDSCGEAIDNILTAQRFVCCEPGCHMKFRCADCNTQRVTVRAWEVAPLPFRVIRMTA